jgi:hypothetical protein
VSPANRHSVRVTAKPSPTLFLASRVSLVVPSWGRVRIADNPTAILSMGAMGSRQST